MIELLKRVRETFYQLADMAGDVAEWNEGGFAYETSQAVKQYLESHEPAEVTMVIFRKWPDGNILALFPEIPSDYNGYNCESYEHVGQHSVADYFGCVQRTKPATEAEYTALKNELEGLGYVFNVVKRVPYSVHRARINSVYSK